MDDRFQMNRELGRLLVAHDVAVLERDSTPRPEYARESLKLARLLELADEKPSTIVKWLIDYLSHCESAGAR